MKARFFRDKPRLVFFLSYTLLFFLAVQVIGFVLPFVIALMTAAVMKPLYDYLRSKFRFRSTFTATALTLLVFGALFAAVGFLLFLVIRQALGFIEANRDVIADYLTSPELLLTLRDNLLSGNLLHTASDVVATLFQAVPLTITFVVITFALTIFFLHRLGAIRRRLIKRAGEEYAHVMDSVLYTAYNMLRRFIRSYLILYLITFVEAVFIYYLTGVPYALAFAFVTAVADILPVLGPGTVYLPLAVFFILQKNIAAGITLSVFFLVTVILRQIIEPKIVSDNVKLHPLLILCAIYFSIVCMNIWVLFYVVSVFLVYKVLDTAGVFEKSATVTPM